MPTSEKQVAANRKYAKKSTGPKSKQGKQTVSTNALKHGMTASTLLLPNEDSGAFDKMMQALWQELIPTGEVEKALVKRIGVQLWRLHRSSSFEQSVIQNKLLVLQAEFKHQTAESFVSGPFDNVLENLKDISDPEERNILLAEEKALVIKSYEGWAGIGHVLLHLAESDVLGKLSRYETTVERSLMRIMQQLIDTQKRRLSTSNPIEGPGTE